MDDTNLFENIRLRSLLLLIFYQSEREQSNIMARRLSSIEKWRREQTDEREWGLKHLLRHFSFNIFLDGFVKWSFFFNFDGLKIKALLVAWWAKPLTLSCLRRQKTIWKVQVNIRVFLTAWWSHLNCHKFQFSLRGKKTKNISQINFTISHSLKPRN